MSYQAEELQEDEVIQEEDAVGKQCPPHVAQRLRLVDTCGEKQWSSVYVFFFFLRQETTTNMLFVQALLWENMKKHNLLSLTYWILFKTE